MAELSSQDVVNHILSAGDASSSDVPETTSESKSISGDGGEVVGAKENGVHLTTQPPTQEDQVLEDSTTRSDTDTSRADGSVGDAKSNGAREVKKFAAAKPVSFAKYSVPKVIAANASKVTPEKVLVPTSSIAPPQPAGRPRLVAKATSSLSQKVKPFKSAAPDPMQVWNKNRITPQPSTKNLTDEELKQQYGIHLTSRLQSDGEGKEAKWADIDDDEDDWAPETIEWADGTKTTGNPADSTPVAKSDTSSKPPTPAIDGPQTTLGSKPALVFSTSIGPNAKVLKLGANAEKQQAQKAAQLAGGLLEKPLPHSSKTSPAPAPAKSPWAKLPPIEKVSPIEINPQVPMGPPPPRQLPNGHHSGFSIPGPSPAKEISADDFNRSWRDSTTPQLFMPNSGRYEQVPENMRRMSRNEQGFRAPAVLQRPGQDDARAPGPSAAFQTNRVSSDVVRRRASSTLSAENAQVVRRMSVKSNEALPAAPETVISEESVQQEAAKSSPAVTPAYQARGGDYISSGAQTDAEIQAQRTQQRALMKEQAEIARKRRQEEEARKETEKQERIRQKLAALGPDPKILKVEQEAKAKAEAEAKALEEAQKAAQEIKVVPTPDVAVASPPKPPQPTATGEPQQYGMMKVHPLDSVKKTVAPVPQQPPTRPVMNVQNLQNTAEDISPEPPVMNGIKSDTDVTRTQDSGPIPEPISRANRPVSAVNEVRAGWGRNDHRSSPTGNLWGVPNNKALGNGTFDQGLAGYAPQDLSSRASSTGQGWMNGKTPTVGQSPQLSHTIQHVPETRSQALQNMTSPEPLPLAMNSEIDSLLPVRPPAPIGPPHVQHHQTPPAHSPVANGYQPTNPNAAIAGWNNFGNVARVQERVEHEQYQREQQARREEEERSGLRPQAAYNFDETFKKTQLGEQPDQRHVSVGIPQINMPPSNMFGAVGSVPPSAVGQQTNRGSRFFPLQVNRMPAPERRAVTYHHIEVPKSPSPPPAEELLSSHPAYERLLQTPVIRFPPEKAVVKLPPAKPVTPLATAPAPAPVAPVAPAAPVQPIMPSQPPQPMTWAARAAMPPPKPAAPLRAVSQPIVQNPSWQERFNGLLGNNARKASDIHQAAQSGSRYPQPSLAVTSASKEPLDVMPAGSASVSLPRNASQTSTDDTRSSTKDVEDEEDLFEDREAGSLPILYFPSDAPAISWPRAIPGRIVPTPPDVQSAYIFFGSQWKEDKSAKPQFAIIRIPGNEKSVKRDLPIRQPDAASNNHRPQARHRGGFPSRRGHRGGKPQHAAINAVKAQ